MWGISWLALIGLACVFVGLFKGDSHAGIIGMQLIIYCKLRGEAV